MSTLMMGRDDGPKVTGPALALGPVVAVAVADVLYICSTGDRLESAAVLLALIVAAVMIGSLVGFLLGMPRYVATKEAEGGAGNYEPSTSLEQISDWLTKILIGVGIAQASSGAKALDNLLDDRVVPALGDGDGAYLVAAASLVAAVVAGFYGAWLLTRLNLAGALREADRDVALLTKVAGQIDDAALKEQVLEVRDAAVESAAAVDERKKARATEFEAAVVGALEPVATSAGAKLADTRLWDALVQKGTTRVAVESKWTDRPEVLASSLRPVIGRLVSGAKQSPSSLLLVTNKPLSNQAQRELDRAEERGFGITHVYVPDSADPSDVGGALKGALG